VAGKLRPPHAVSPPDGKQLAAARAPTLPTTGNSSPRPPRAPGDEQDGGARGLEDARTWRLGQPRQHVRVLHQHSLLVQQQEGCWSCRPSADEERRRDRTLRKLICVVNLLRSPVLPAPANGSTPAAVKPAAQVATASRLLCYFLTSRLWNLMATAYRRSSATASS
jgi:hypothetical protein